MSARIKPSTLVRTAKRRRYVTWPSSALFVLVALLATATAQSEIPETKDRTVATARQAYFSGQYEEARSIAYELAQNEDAEAQLLMAQMLREGKARSPNYVEAVRWVRRAADRGDALAQVDMGISYRNGRGVTKNFIEAAKWFRRAAVKGHPVAQDQLAWMYVSGEGVSKNYLAGYAWFSIALAQGWDRSKEAMELIEKALPASQIAAAQKMSDQCLQSRYVACDW